ncbi:MAG TPA: polysaccharide pyruvyl transferase family protein [Pirellulales bacterium]
MQRRTFLQTGAVLALAISASAQERRAPRILLRSSWQVVNIGDVAHTPGVLALIEKHIPDAEVILWASGDLSEEVAEMEHKRFPKLKIVKGTLKADGRGSSADLDEAVKWADFLLHGSGPSLVAAKDVAAFVEHTRKPFGVYGITYQRGGASRELMSQAKFLYFRDSVSLKTAKDDGITCPIMAFGPDGAFACDLRNDAAADEFLKQHDLQPGKFVCCIPRLRFTPYWLVKAGRPLDEKKHSRNEEMKEHDHAPLRDAIAAVTRETDCKVLVCPEDMTHMAVGKEMIVDKLPDDVLKKVVWKKDFWLTDQAVSTYVRSVGLFGLEMHSPIMCIGNGVPALVGRFSEQTSKGIMWRDVGLDEWLFDFDRPDDLARLTPAVLEMIRRPEAAREKVAQARALVAEKHRQSMAVVEGAARAKS